jgi:hypothetical protein
MLLFGSQQPLSRRPTPNSSLLTPNFYTTWRQLCAILKINNDWGHWMNRILIVEEEKRKIYRITELGKEILHLEIKRIERLYKNSKGEKINE